MKGEPGVMRFAREANEEVASGAPEPGASEVDAALGPLAGASPAEILAWVEATYGARAVVTSSFGAESVVVIDLAVRHAPSVRFATLDTGRLDPETYETMERVRQRYGITIETYRPDPAAVERLERDHGWFSFRESLEARRACCAVRKVDPLERVLSGRAAWVTGRRSEQGPTRVGLAILERDPARRLVKVNPLARWTERDVWQYVRANGLPYNALYDRGYRSIGCAPCTRPTRPGEDARAGRWWWEEPDHKECGLHLQPRRPT